MSDIRRKFEVDEFGHDDSVTAFASFSPTKTNTAWSHGAVIILTRTVSGRMRLEAVG